MAAHNELGKAGEDAAVRYLEANDYVIRHRNWRRGHLELDIVAAKDEELIIVEVKTRASTLFSQPAEAVNRQKIRRIVRATDAYVKTYQLTNPVRFDVITIVGIGGDFNVEHLPEAFYPPLM
jgi:putative endonuclease